MPDEAQSPPARKKFMVVDDHPLFRNLLRTLLAGPNEEVVEMSDGEDAVLAYQTHRPDWVIMDIEMPVLDGLTAAREIKAGHPEAHIAIVSQHAEDEYRKEAESIGVEVFLSKSNVVHLKETLNRLNQS